MCLAEPLLPFCRSANELWSSAAYTAGQMGCPCSAWRALEIFEVIETYFWGKTVFLPPTNSMSETNVDVFDPKLLASIFLLTEGRDVARLRLVCKGWQHIIDDSQVVICSFSRFETHCVDERWNILII